MCCCISGEPTEDPTGRLKTFSSQTKFQVGMMEAPCVDSWKSCGWFCGQFMPCTCGIAQYRLRKNILLDDMTKYSCFQGYFDCCGFFKAGSCGEQSCPDLCLFLEGCVCNCMAISASRAYVMEKYDLSSDPCDYRLIRINNCLQALACLCSILAIFISELRQIARLLSIIADVFYHTISGCMTAQVAYEQKFQNALENPDLTTPITGNPIQDKKF
ncbi:hypothetical protein B484DRAFT_96148 [Ochromonadaceae sp. CCMP2298]|nr:hypothetical protein B484DRAFT_96148 [Ochromonadaceae sp. CCMP2298]|mmetsp:Transcript_4989/g.11081  ORF Transcript_4989/g.11081 Transcript_4989/m.11081 type:complete len:215 (-) Transcript_4989:156-800(-)